MAYPKFLGSSQNPEKLALTVKGLAIYIIPIIIVIGKASGVELAETDLIALVNNIALIIASVVAGIGLIRKIITQIKK